LNIKLSGCHFDTNEVIEAESQAVLNTLTEHDFQDATKKTAEALGMVHTQGRGQKAALVPEIMDSSLSIHLRPRKNLCNKIHIIHSINCKYT
jgi:hypothetical protein